LSRKISYKPPRVAATPDPEPETPDVDLVAAGEDLDDTDAVPDILSGPVEVTIEEGIGAERLDAALAKRLPSLSRSRLKALITEGHVRSGGATLTDPSRRVNAGDRITVEVPKAAPAVPEGEAIPLDIVHEDADLLVIEKPAGLVVHPGAGNWSGTLVNALIAHCGASLSGIGGVARPGIVHRLDKDTTGLMVVAKTDRAHIHLSRQFADHGRKGPLERAYLAVVWGAPQQRVGTLESLIGRSPRNREQMAVVKSGGREAITHYEVLESFSLPEAGTAARRKVPGAPPAEVLASLVECRLETGRTHQIRVHMAAMGHPLLGDTTYGSGFRTKVDKLRKVAPEVADALTALERQALHAYLLAFQHPVTKEVMRFEGDIPADLPLPRRNPQVPDAGTPAGIHARQALARA
jgi:23S rRNA pseudouridine1911/1915/1917 synthase